MEVRIAVVDGDSVDLKMLADWLRQEPELAARVKLYRPEPQEGQLGSLAEEILVTAASSGGVITDALVASLTGWLTPLSRSYTRIRIKGGRVVDVEVGRLDEARVEALIRQALAPGTADRDGTKLGKAGE